MNSNFKNIISIIIGIISASGLSAILWLVGADIYVSIVFTVCCFAPVIKGVIETIINWKRNR